MFVDCAGTLATNVTVHRTLFEANFIIGNCSCGSYGGGALYVKGAGSLTVSDCKFTRNWSQDSAGALMVRRVGTHSITRTLFDSNYAGGLFGTSTGGAVVTSSGSFLYLQVTWRNNSMVGTGDGGAMAFNTINGESGNSQGFINASYFYANSAAQLSGGVIMGDQNSNFVDLSMNGCAFCDNKHNTASRLSFSSPKADFGCVSTMTGLVTLDLVRWLCV